MARVAHDERPAHAAAVAGQVHAVLLREDADVGPDAAAAPQLAQGRREVRRPAVDAQDAAVYEHQRRTPGTRRSSRGHERSVWLSIS